MAGEIFENLEKLAADVVDGLIDTIIGPPQILMRATEEREIDLPRDLYAHDDVQTEWWYYTGHLWSGERPFGFELVFFKRRTDRDRFGRIIPMRVISPVNYYAHFAVTDIEAGQFRYAHRRSINGRRPAGASEVRHKIWLDDWSAREVGDLHIISARMNGTQLELALKPVKPIIKHGLNGLSYKDSGEASYYLSYTRMEAEGELIVGGKGRQVTGTAWMDHEFGTWTMKEKIQGWDWFALQLDGNREIMAFLIRNKNGIPTRYSEAVLIEADGSAQRFSHEEFNIFPTGEWRSRQSGAVYPSGWRLEIPALDAELEIEPALRCQELDTRGSTMIVYWEGAAAASGRLAGKPTKGRAYIELVGYDRSHEDLTLFDYLKNEMQFRSLGFY